MKLTTLLSRPHRRSRGWIYYDGSCGLCTTWRHDLGPIVERRGFHLAALQEPWVQRRLGLRPDEVPEEMKLETPRGRILGGVDALVYIWGRIWWAWPLYLAAQLPIVRRGLWRLYRPLCANRYAVGGRCPVHLAPADHRLLE